ncbi:prepilin peptidase [Streptomyces lydicus]|uniref:prepilin peptidase n=1 Tax=Streptomyces lydicus TaxID=47763 RepID=UPI0036EDC015
MALATSAVSAAAAAVTGWRPELLVWLLLAPFAVAAAATDWEVHRIPDALTLPMAVATLTLLSAAALLPHHEGSALTAAAGALALAATFLLIAVLNPRGLGLGDVKLALTVGAATGWYGWTAVAAAALAAHLLGAIYGVALLVSGRAGRHATIPFAPMMLLGTLFGMVLGTSSRL